MYIAVLLLPTRDRSKKIVDYFSIPLCAILHLLAIVCTLNDRSQILRFYSADTYAHLRSNE